MLQFFHIFPEEQQKKKNSIFAKHSLAIKYLTHATVVGISHCLRAKEKILSVEVRPNCFQEVVSYSGSFPWRGEALMADLKKKKKRRGGWLLFCLTSSSLSQRLMSSVDWFSFSSSPCLQKTRCGRRRNRREKRRWERRERVDG